MTSQSLDTVTAAASTSTRATSKTAVTVPTTTTTTATAETAKHWVGVVSREHVRRGTALGIAQLGHGKRTGLARLRPGDWLIYYSPRTSFPDGEPLQSFTAIGQIADEEIWQADEGGFNPWRRRVRYEADARETSVRKLTGALGLTAGPNWGNQLRRGLVELSAEDFAVIRSAMIGA